MTTQPLNGLFLGAASLVVAACGVAVGTPDRSPAQPIDATAFETPLDLEDRTVRTATFALG